MHGHRVVWVVVQQTATTKSAADEYTLDASDENKHPFFATLPKLSPVATR